MTCFIVPYTLDPQKGNYVEEAIHLYVQLILTLMQPWIILKIVKFEAIYHSLAWNSEWKVPLKFILWFQHGLQTMLVLYVEALLLVAIFKMSAIMALLTAWCVLYLLVKIREAPRKNYP